MRDYQPVKNNKYLLPKSVWNRTIWLIRDYNRMQAAADNIISIGGNSFETPVKGGKTKDLTAAYAEKREAFLHDIEIINYEFRQIPEEYRAGIWDNIQTGKRYPLYADRTTFSRWKSRFIYQIAKQKKYI